MADEITAALSVSINNNGSKGSKSFTSKRGDQSGSGSGAPGLVNVGTSEETLDLSDYRYIILSNEDDTNYVEYGFATGVYNAELPPGGIPTFLKVKSGKTLYWRANTAACDVDVFGINA